MDVAQSRTGEEVAEGEASLAEIVFDFGYFTFVNFSLGGHSFCQRQSGP